jgi:hypothetical protein
MSPTCPACGQAGFRTSHLRLSDFFHLLKLQVPVRCSTCNQRTFVPLLSIKELGRTK